jgi:hypothetical protein
MTAGPSFAILDGEYDAFIKHLRQAFQNRNGGTCDVTITAANASLLLTFRTADQYLVGLQGANISERNQHYSNMPAPSILTYGQIASALHCGSPPLNHLDLGYLRIIAFITAEAARFHIVSRNVSQLIREMNDSTAISFHEADFIIKNYDNARRLAGIPDSRFEPIIDTYVHRVRRSAIDLHENIPGMGGNEALQRVGVINDVLKPKLR